VQFTGAIEGPLNYTKFKLFLLSRVQRMKYLFLIVFIPFMILLIKPKDKILYSLVFDNSQSMENQLGFAKNVIKDLTGKLKDNSTFVLTTIPLCYKESECLKLQNSSKRKLEKIISQKIQDSVIGSTFVAKNNNDLLEYIDGESLDISQIGSPIYECIWNNFIISTEENKNQSYSKKKLIIMTDGADNLYAKEFGFVRPSSSIFAFNLSNSSMNDFYNEISIINYENLNTDQNLISQTCPEVTVMEGTDLLTFEKAFLESLSQTYLDYYFVLLLLSILVIGFLSILFTQ
jgi:hypothetical protein